MSDNEEPSAVPALIDDAPRTTRQKLWLFTLVAFKRIRFIAILAAVGLFIGYWDTVKNYWDKWARPAGVGTRELAAGQEFYCPMDPQVVRITYEPNGDVPKCPICGMPLSTRTKGEVEPLPEGVTGRVQLTPERVQLAGVKTVPVQYETVARQMRTVGMITYDESRLARVVSRVEGYVEKLYVDTTYAMVREGQPLLAIYSPELYATSKELLVAARNKAVPGMVESARRKLKLLGVSDEEIQEILDRGEPAQRLVIRSPRSGLAVEKKIVVGSSVDAKMTLLEVADLSSVWLEAEVYEKDLPYLRVGQPAETTVESLPGRTFTGEVALIYPKVEAATRTTRIRVELANPDLELRPNMYATVRIAAPLDQPEGKPDGVRLASHKDVARGQILVVPQRAVVDTGAKKVVYVERAPGVFEGVEVQLGPRSGEVYPVLKGLEPGDRVVAAGAFLIDAETRLNPSAAGTYFGASGGPQSGGTSAAGGSAHQGHPPPPRSEDKQTAAPAKKPAELTDAQRKQIEQLPAEDRELALAQKICPVTDKPLGSMGVPVKITLRDQPVLLCCRGCAGKAKRSPEEMLRKIERK